MAIAALSQPSASTSDLLREGEQSLMFTVNRPDLVMVRGKGNYLWDADGKRYLDFIAGWAVTCLGHSPPALVRAMNRQAKVLINASPALLNEPMIRFAKLLTGLSCLDKVFFTSSGAEANEGALKLARKYGAVKLNGAYEVVTTWNSFHGRTLAMMSATGKEAWESLFEPKVPGFVKVPFNDLKAMRQAVTDKTCAIMIELVQGEAGVFTADKKYMRGLRELCDERGILLILDEIQTGFGRIGKLFGYEHYGIEPDIMTLGKGIGGGFPLSAMMAKDAACVFEPGDQGGTYTAQPLAMAAGLATVTELIAKKLPRKAHLRGNYLRRQLKVMSAEFGFTEMRGMGLLQAVDLPQPKAADVAEMCRLDGLLINAPRPETLRFMPALTISKKEIDEMVGILSGAMRRVL